MSIAEIVRQVAAAIAFYTILPVPASWELNFQPVARFAPLIGLLIGALLSLLDLSLAFVGIPRLTRCALLSAAWIFLTGGLHLDGAMDTADGLATQNPERRLAVMADSASGAFGVMAAIVILLLKTTALNDLSGYTWFALIGAAAWGRWGQQLAIACHPYLKPTGKGAFHKAALPSFVNTLPCLILLLGLSGLLMALDWNAWPLAITLAIGGVAIASATAAWFNHQLGGHTGDTYGAVVEWTEALLLCLLTVVVRRIG